MEVIVKPWLRKTLRRLRGARSFSQPYLPPETWRIILLYVIEVPFVFDTGCESKGLSSIRVGDSGTRVWYDEAERERKKLRLVCKMWANFLDPHSMRWVCHRQHWKPNGRGIKRLDIRDVTYRANESVSSISIRSRLQPKHVESILAMPQTRSSLSTIRLDFVSVVPSKGTIQYILDQVADYSSIRTFGYKIRETCTRYLTQQLQKRFSSITTLEIEATEIIGPLRLEKLETLYLDTSTYDADNWWFPSLKHCAFGCQVVKGYGWKTSLIPGPRHQIRSLYLKRLTSPVRIDAQFWQDLPLLEFLGGCAQWMAIVDSAPLDHPLVQL
ncbi:hypothetical protein CPB86DRAFT_696227, partial [Serendipita vermifera]